MPPETASSETGPSGEPGCEWSDRNPPWWFAAFTFGCLAVAVATQMAVMASSLDWWIHAASRRQPYELRLRLNPLLKDAILAARATREEASPGTPILIDNRGGPDWFLALRLQPRRVFFDRPVVRQRLIRADEPFVVVRLEANDRRTTWRFTHVAAPAPPGVKPNSQPMIFRDGFENDLRRWDGWSSKGAD
ncbi:MAG: hypothetical protein PVG53_14250 [Holophagae bacterium]|jgi:hypothetical protein